LKPFGAFFEHRRLRIGLCEVPYRFHRVLFEVQTFLIATLPTPCSVVKVFFFLLPSVSWHVICAGGNASFVLAWPLEGFLRCRVLWLCSLCVCGFIASYAPLCSAAALWFLFLMPALMVIARTLARAYLCFFCCRRFTKGLAVRIRPLISHVFLFCVGVGIVSNARF
jgi:hypothetical protein